MSGDPFPFLCLFEDGSTITEYISIRGLDSPPPALTSLSIWASSPCFYFHLVWCGTSRLPYKNADPRARDGSPLLSPFRFFGGCIFCEFLPSSYCSFIHSRPRCLFIPFMSRRPLRSLPQLSQTYPRAVATVNPGVFSFPEGFGRSLPPPYPRFYQLTPTIATHPFPPSIPSLRFSPSTSVMSFTLGFTADCCTSHPSLPLPLPSVACTYMQMPLLHGHSLCPLFLKYLRQTYHHAGHRISSSHPLTSSLSFMQAFAAVRLSTVSFSLVLL